MVQLFRPQHEDALASRVDTWPYVHNICQYLPLNEASLYRQFIDQFDNGNISEATLHSFVHDSGMFHNQPEVLYLHDDLVVVIIMNKVDASLPTAKSPNIGANSASKVPLETIQGIASSEAAGDKVDVTKERPEDSVNEEADAAVNTLPGKQAAGLATPAATPPAEPTPRRRAKRNQPVGGWEQANLAKEAELFLTNGKRSTRTSGTSGLRRRSRVDYKESP